MKTYITACGSGGVVMKDDTVLLVKVTYGANKGYWMLPGGRVEPGETFEQAAVREMLEESGIEAKPGRLIAVRSGIRELIDHFENGIYFIFEMQYISGAPAADGSEVSEAQFRPLNDVLEDPFVVELTKEVIRSFTRSTPLSGLNKVQQPLTTNTNYITYEVYTSKGE